MNEFKTIWHISDTHGIHEHLVIPDNIDIVIHSGDFSNYHRTFDNKPEALEFLQWYSKIDVPYKVLVAGNHDAYACNKPIEFAQTCHDLGIIYLKDDFCIIKGIKIYGTPYTPQFGDWHFMKPRHSINKVYNLIPEDVDILVTHGPPYGILDMATDTDNNDEHCGCKSLLNKICYELNIKMNLFGHIHDNEYNLNQGIVSLNSIQGVIFSNGSVVKDKYMNQLNCNGNILKYEL
jgi:Icc-related predicted phosphoesterase